MIDDRLPEMPSDLDETTPVVPHDPVVTPPTPRPALPVATGSVAALPRATSSPLHPVPRATAISPPPPVPPAVPGKTPPPLPGALPMVPMPPVLPPQYLQPGYAPDPGMPELAPDEPEPAWTRDTMIEGMIEGVSTTPTSDGPTMRRVSSGPPPAQAPVTSAIPILRLCTKRISAATGLIVVARISRAATHHGSREPETPTAPQPGAGLPPATAP